MPNDTTPTPTTDQPTLAVLKPCPFCGGEAKRITLAEPEENAGGDVIYCTGVCGASSHIEFGRKENLVSLWNTRTTHEPRPAGDLREALEAFGALLATHDEDEGMDDFADEDSVGAYKDEDGTIHDLPLTFGILRRARRAFAALATHSPAPINSLRSASESATIETHSSAPMAVAAMPRFLNIADSTEQTAPPAAAHLSAQEGGK